MFTKTLDINVKGHLSLFVWAVEEDGDERVGGAAVGHDLVREEDPVDAILVPHQQRLLRILAPLSPRPVNGEETYFRGL